MIGQLRLIRLGHKLGRTNLDKNLLQFAKLTW